MEKHENSSGVVKLSQGIIIGFKHILHILLGPQIRYAQDVRSLK